MLDDAADTRPMTPFPETPPFDGADGFDGHLWVQELATGGRLRFRVEESGLVTFGTPDETFAGADAAPPPYRRAADAISRQIDRDALRRAVEQPARVTFFGRATRNEGVDYDWTALPPFVGIDVWSPGSDGRLPPDAATTVFRRLGLSPLPAVEKEVRAAHADLGRYETTASVPPSVWRDGPVAAVLVRDKTGGRARIRHRDHGPPPDPVTRAPAEVAADIATDERIQRTVDRLDTQARPPAADAVCRRLVADVARERYARLRGADGHVTATQAFQSAVAARVQRYLQRE
ncbi:MAG: hypothetical protein ABEJ43_10375 [Haloferacaceae archaeon]